MMRAFAMNTINLSNLPHQLFTRLSDNMGFKSQSCFSKAGGTATRLSMSGKNEEVEYTNELQNPCQIFARDLTRGFFIVLIRVM